MAEKNWFFALVGGLFRFLDRVRKTLQFVFLMLITLVLLTLLSPAPPVVPDSAALVLAPVGSIVDQLDGDAAARAWQDVTGTRVRQTLARDLIDAINAARDDKRIKALVLRLNSMGGAGMSTLRDLGAAIDSFKTSGKRVIAIGDAYPQNRYYLAARADEIYMHPQGFVFLQGFGAYRTYYKEAIDKLHIDWNVFKVGEYKSFVEPYTRNDMSPEARDNALEWLGGLWEVYAGDVIEARGLDEAALERYTERLPDLSREARGDLGVLALETGLVDALKTHHEMSERIAEFVGRDDEDHGFKGVHHAEYVEALRFAEAAPDGARVGVIVASGEIVGGHQPPGKIGGETVAELIRRTRLNDDIKAVVLRVDSPGGSAFASEVIGSEVELLREQGKPVVVSMGSVAASGGYWISMAADEIWASPSTITGSIGIGGYFPTFQRTFDKLGIHVDGVGTTPWAGEFRSDRKLSEPARQLMQLSIENGYERFITKVADARDMTMEKVDAVARGRVWLGSDAQRVGLVDNLGNLDAAVESAAALAGLGEEYDVEYIERQPSIREALIMQVARLAYRLRGSAGDPLSYASPLVEAADRLRADLERLATWNDPRGMYYHCMCDMR